MAAPPSAANGVEGTAEGGLAHADPADPESVAEEETGKLGVAEVTEAAETTGSEEERMGREVVAKADTGRRRCVSTL